MLQSVRMIRFESLLAACAVIAFIGFAIAGCVEESRKAAQATSAYKSGPL